MNNNEIWIPISGYEGMYEASNMGRIRGLDRIVLQGNRWLNVKGMVMNPTTVKNGYQTVSLIHSKFGKKSHLIHRLIFSAFIKEIPFGYDVHHIDEDKSNNNIENLKILTKREHMTLHALLKQKTSSYIGVVKLGNRWKAEIQAYSKRRLHLGVFDSEIDAANAYQEALKSILSGTEIKVHKKKFTYVCFKNREKKWCATYKCKKVGMYNTKDEALKAVAVYIENYNKNT